MLRLACKRPATCARHSIEAAHRSPSWPRPDHAAQAFVPVHIGEGRRPPRSGDGAPQWRCRNKKQEAAPFPPPPPRSRGRCLPHTFQRLLTHVSVLCPVCALLALFPLGPRPWLHRLRGRFPALFVSFPEIMAETERSSRSCIIGYGSSPSRCGPQQHKYCCRRPTVRFPGSRPESVCTVPGLRPRRAGRALALAWPKGRTLNTTRQRGVGIGRSALQGVSIASDFANTSSWEVTMKSSKQSS